MLESDRKFERMALRLTGLSVFVLAGSLIHGSKPVLAKDSSDAPPGLTVEMLDQMTSLPGKIGPLPAVPVPEDNPQTAAKIDLGRRLYFDTRMSGDKTISCATCHDPNKGYSDGKPTAIGFDSKILNRRSPTVLNAAYNTSQFWDGRAKSLEDQAQGPIMAKGEMNIGTEESMIERLIKVPDYNADFKRIFGRGPSLVTVAKAIAAFERTLITPNSRFDRYMTSDKSALSVQEKRGLLLFIGKANCSACHNGPNFTDNKFHNLGVPQIGPLARDLGRYDVTKNESDKGAFKTPSLRNVVARAPYMHDGAEISLKDVIEFYDKGGGKSSNKSPLIFPLGLTDQEKKDLLAFLSSLDGILPQISVPKFALQK